MTEPLHIKARPEDVADRVVVAGDPARVEQLAGYLDKARLISKKRGFLLYTGKYEGVPVSVCVHGIGGPSSSIVFEELKMLGAKVIVRFGSCGAMVKDLDIGDYVIPTGASYTIGGTIWTYAPYDCTAAVPDYDVLTRLVKNAAASGLKFRVGPVVGSDAFYVDAEKFLETWIPRGMVAVEMECATLFVLGRLRGFKTGAFLVVSDNVVKAPGVMVGAEELAKSVEKGAKVVFKSIVEVDV